MPLTTSSISVDDSSDSSWSTIASSTAITDGTYAVTSDSSSGTEATIIDTVRRFIASTTSFTTFPTSTTTAASTILSVTPSSLVTAGSMVESTVNPFAPTTGAGSSSTMSFIIDSTNSAAAADLTSTTATSAPASSSPTLHSMVNVADLSSSLQHFGYVDYFVFILMLIVCAVIGFYFGFIEKKNKKKRNNEQRRDSEALDYLVGGRKMKVFPVALSLVASFVSGISLLGTSTEIYVYGTQYAFILITLVISGVISWYVFLPVFCNLQLTSTYEIVWLPIVIYVPALAFNQVTGANIHIVTPVVCIVCIFYTCVLAKAKDQLVPLLVMDILGVLPGMPGIFVAGVFSAALSSLSTGLNSLSAVFLEDYIKPIRKKPLTELQTAIIMRLSVVLIGILCVGLVFVVERMGTVLQLSMTLGSITSGPLLGLFLMGLLLPWINSKSALFGSVISFCIMSWVCVKAQLAISARELVYPEKSVTTQGCDYLFEEVFSSSANQTRIADGSKSFIQYIYHMSFMFYVPVGSLLGVAFACIASVFFGCNDPSKMDIALFSPFVRNFIKPVEYVSVQPDEQIVIMGLEVKDSLKS